MDWQSIRQRWRQDEAPPVFEAAIAALRQRELELHAKVRRRDRLETLAALLVVPFFAVLAVRYGLRAQWLPCAFACLIALWAAYVPWRLWQARRRQPQRDPAQPLTSYLRAEREALLAQARMLEAVWLWYIAPCALGILGLVFSSGPATLGKWIYCAIVLAFCGFIGWANHYAARTQFRAQAADIDTQLCLLNQEDAP